MFGNFVKLCFFLAPFFLLVWCCFWRWFIGGCLAFFFGRSFVVVFFCTRSLAWCFPLVVAQEQRKEKEERRKKEEGRKKEERRKKKDVRTKQTAGNRKNGGQKRTENRRKVVFSAVFAKFDDDSHAAPIAPHCSLSLSRHFPPSRVPAHIVSLLFSFRRPLKISGNPVLPYQI